MARRTKPRRPEVDDCDLADDSQYTLPGQREIVLSLLKPIDLDQVLAAAGWDGKHCDVGKYKGVIVDRAVANWYKLPRPIQQRMPLQDYIQEGYVFAIKVLYGTKTRKARWDPKRGARPETLLYTTLNHFYENVALGLTCPKRGAITLSLDDETMDLSNKLATKATFEEMADAEDVVRRLHQQASYELVRFLDEHLFSRTAHKVVTWGSRFQRHRHEFQQLAKRTGCTIEHYRVAIALHDSTMALKR